MGIQVEIISDVGYDLGTVAAMTPDEFVQLVQPEIKAFEAAFTGMGQSALIGVERSLLLTYLAWKLGKLK